MTNQDASRPAAAAAFARSPLAVPRNIARQSIAVSFQLEMETRGEAPGRRARAVSGRDRLGDAGATLRCPGRKPGLGGRPASRAVRGRFVRGTLFLLGRLLIGTGIRLRIRGLCGQVREGVGVALVHAHDASRRMAGEAAARIDRDAVAGDEIDVLFFLGHDGFSSWFESHARSRGPRGTSRRNERGGSGGEGWKRKRLAGLSSARRIYSP